VGAVKQQDKQIKTSEVVTALLQECSAITSYHTLQDSLPRKLVHLLRCRCVLFYQRIGETLQFTAGSSDDKPGWSTSLLTLAHINPIDMHSDVPEACAWRERCVIGVPAEYPTLVAAPLIYRQRGIGVLVAARSDEEGPACWLTEEIAALEAVAAVVALLLENTRLLERDRERIHELSLLNSISSQMNCSMYELDRFSNVVVQRTKEISAAELCELLKPGKMDTHSTWITPALCEALLQRFQVQREPTLLLVERPGTSNDKQVNNLLQHLPANIKTFFAVPLFSGRRGARREGSLLAGSSGAARGLTHEPKILGIIVGAYHHAWKLRHAEIVLLQVLASQASAVLENMHLMAEVVEARNEARKLLRQVLEDRRLKALILESIPSGLITVDCTSTITAFNRAAAAILGYHPYEVIGQPLQKVLDLQAALAQEEDIWQRRGLSEELQESTVGTIDRYGRDIVLDVDMLPLCDDQGERIGSLIAFTDVTSVHRLEEEKRRLDRLASLGEMAANVAHEVRNPLASIKTSMQMLVDDLRSGAQNPQIEGQNAWVQESIAVVLKEVERLDGIVRDLLLFARPRQLHRSQCQVTELSDQVLQFIQPQCTEANVVIHRVYNEVPAILLDAVQIEQVLLNLFLNALQAMPDGGILTVTCQLLPAERVIVDTAYEEAFSTQTPERHRYAMHVPGSSYNHESAREQWLEIAVSDTGVGIPSDQLERIFQPFFTTKAHGIGLGLAITRRLVEDHGGYIRVEGHYGYGATIAVRFPLIQDMGPPVSKDRAEALLEGRGNESRNLDH
jgi:PAS domain S-box-containing protein